MDNQRSDAESASPFRSVSGQVAVRTGAPTRGAQVWTNAAPNGFEKPRSFCEGFGLSSPRRVEHKRECLLREI